MRFLHRLLIAFAALALPLLSHAQSPERQLLWEQLPDLPAPSKDGEQKGLAGLFGGVHNDVLILAGGANYPDAAPWKHGVRSFWNDIYVLEKSASGKPKWASDTKAKLPKPIAYGASVSTPHGIVCIGGIDASQCYTDVFILKWNPDTREVAVDPLPPLPSPLAHCTAALVGDVVYVAGGISDPFSEATDAFFALDLDPDPQPDPQSDPDPDADPKKGEKAEPGDLSSDSTADPTPAEKPTGDTKSPEDDPKPADPKPAETNTGADPPKEGSEKPDEPSPTPDEDTPASDPSKPDKPDPTEPEGDPAKPEGDPSEPAPIKPEVIEEPDSPNPKNPSEKPDPKEVETEKPEPDSTPAPKVVLAWKELPSWDGPPRAFAASAAQSVGENKCFFLFSGRNPKPNGTSDLLVDSHKFDPANNTWTNFPDVALPDENARGVVAAAACADGDHSVLIFGGDNGTMAKVSALVVSASNSTSKDAYLKLNETILENHPGYSRDILSLDTIAGVWMNVATFPEFCPVTTPVIRWGDSFIIPSGEIRPGVRSPKIWKGTWKSK